MAWLTSAIHVLVVAICAFITTARPAEGLVLAERLREAKAGDYLVILQERTATLLLVREVDNDHLILEEISAPVTARGQYRWSEWIQHHAPGYCSWTTYFITPSGLVEHAYSHSRCGWMNIGNSDPFLSTLLRLSFTEIPPSERRRIGPPAPGGLDQRPVWNPPLIYEGRRQLDSIFVAYHAVWPRDGSPLGGREVLIYMPQQEGPYPAYFPYWLEVKAALKDSNLRVLDSGRGLISPKPKPSVNRCR